MKVRKKPIVLDCFRWHPMAEQPQWVRNAFADGTLRSGVGNTLIVNTDRGPVTAMLNDYLFKGVFGEIYPVPPGLFDASYDIVEETDR